MKKVGIMSMQRVANYGSFLQAYGLKKMIEELGYETEFVDYEKGKSLIKKKKQLLDKIKRNKNPFVVLKRRKIQNELESKYRNEFLPKMGVKETMNYRPNDIDALVIGSDEVFNPVQPDPMGFSKELFGYHYEKIPVISYAACFGYCKYEDLEAYGIADDVKNMLAKFKSISVRDENSSKIVNKLLGKPPVINLDPVLMYDFKEESKESSYNFENYIAIYAYSGRFTKEEILEIKRIAKKYDKKIVSIGFYHKFADICVVPDIFEIFDLFKKADFVITDTFHGTIFSIKGGTNFCSIIRSTHSNKLGDLLNRLGLVDRIVKSPNELENKYLNKPNYVEPYRIIDIEKRRTRDYLRKSL